MRFLFVYATFSEPARQLLDQLQVTDVTLIIARKGAETPTPDEIALLKMHPQADAAGCELNRGYRKSAGAYVKFCCEPKKFRIQDKTLHDWLVPPGTVAQTFEKPSVAFLAAAAKAPLLVIHPNALTQADTVPNFRWRFMTHSANLLARYARNEQLGASCDWKAKHGVDFANVGKVGFKYTVSDEIETVTGESTYHLKGGDSTSVAAATRVYFARVALKSGVRIVVFYAGPHPPNGVQTVYVLAPIPPKV